VLAGRFHYDPGNCSRRPVGRLSKRQAEVLALIGKGLTDQEIADRLRIGESTVRHHLEMLFIKLSVERRAEIAAAAAIAGLSSYGTPVLRLHQTIRWDPHRSILYAATWTETLPMVPSCS